MTGSALAMRLRIALLSDPMIRLLVVAVLLAIFVPAEGEARDLASRASSVAIFALFLLNGIRVPRSDILCGLTNWRYFLPLLLFVFGAMPLIGLAFSRLGELYLPLPLALGFLFLGSLPSTVQSATSYTNLADGNVGLAVIGAALLSMAGVFVSAPLFALLGGGAAVSTGADAVVRIGTMLVLPFGIGQLVQTHFYRRAVEYKSQLVWLDRFVIALAVYVAMSGAARQGLFGQFGGSLWALLLVSAFGMLVTANLVCWAVGMALRLEWRDRIAFLFAGTQKSVVVGAPLAAILFSPAMAGLVIAPLLLYHLFQLMLAAPLASWLATHPR